MNRNIKLIIGLGVILLFIFSIIYITGDSDSSKDSTVNNLDSAIKNNAKGGPNYTTNRKDNIPNENMSPAEDMKLPPAEDRGFPPEAIEACENLEEGDVCTAETPEGEESGACVLMEEGLVCLFDKPNQA